ncbi:putative ycgL domain-containing protein [Candidatus Erwinia dacicola]|uniref:YcgL domain-containing protein n=1 Tax=Candidatus Erwinia dacicola TaxID=252393 RepID=A0A328TPU3_9GAMM|nr:putative ycgL domain-containing protein [Candidatus Erwinia dacicola]
MGVDIEKVKAALRDEGFYLQMPLPVKSLLKIHLENGKMIKKFN